MKIQVKKIDPSARLPHYAHPGDAGMDLYSSVTVEIPAGERVLVKTGISLALPEGYVGLVWDKSGLAVKAGLTTIAGVIDSGYRGEVHVALYNTSNKTYLVEAGKKIAQLLVQPIVQGTLEEVDELTDTSRGNGGFGSTGL